MVYRYLNIDELNIDEIAKSVSKERIEKASKFKHEDDKKRSLCVEYLLDNMLKEHFDIDSYNIAYDEKGKPHIYNDDGDDLIHFSLSHSGKYVACIISDVPCGIDIEKHSEKREYEKIAKRICTEEELIAIKDKYDFYNVWTLKESVLKAVGLGLALDMKTVILRRKEEKDNEYITKIDECTYKGKVLSAPDGYSLSYVEKTE